MDVLLPPIRGPSRLRLLLDHFSRIEDKRRPEDVAHKLNEFCLCASAPRSPIATVSRPSPIGERLTLPSCSVSWRAFWPFLAVGSGLALAHPVARAAGDGIRPWASFVGEADEAPFGGGLRDPRMRNWRKPRACLVWPNTGSGSCLRKR